jgi:hypothetical protein
MLVRDAQGFQGVKGCRAKADDHQQQRAVLAQKNFETHDYSIKVVLHDFQGVLQRSVSQTYFHADPKCLRVLRELLIGQHCHQYRFLQLAYNHKRCCKPVVSRL